MVFFGYNATFIDRTPEDVKNMNKILRFDRYDEGKSNQSSCFVYYTPNKHDYNFIKKSNFYIFKII